MLAPSQDEGYHLDKTQLDSNRKLMLFDLATGGHHPIYIQHLVRYWSKEELPGKLDIVVSPKFIEDHSDIVDLSLSCSQNNIRFLPISVDEYSHLKNQSFFLTRIYKEWSLYYKYAKQLQADHCLIMYLDHLQLPIAFAGKSPCSFSGIYFRPTFHYDEFDNYVPSWKERVRQWRQKYLLAATLQNPKFKTLFCLDPFSVKHIKKIPSQVKITHLPDPVPTYNNDSEVEAKAALLKIRLGIDKCRRVFLLFGSLESRKGIYQLLDAVQLLSPAVCEKLCILLVGSIIPSDKFQIEAHVEKISQTLPVQIIIRDQFIPEKEVQLYFQVADVVLAPYQRHVGMSGILLLAAAAQKPVLTSNYGLMGAITQKYKLGLTVDSTEARLIAKGLNRCLIEFPESFCDRDKMNQFVNQNDAIQFSSTILEDL